MNGLWVQYLEKIGAEIARTTFQANKSDILRHCQSRGTVVQAIATCTTGGYLEGGTTAVFDLPGVARDDVCDCAIQEAAIGQGMILDITKDLQGIIGDASNPLAENSRDAEAHMRRLILRQTFYAVVQTSAVNLIAAEVTYLYTPAIFIRFMERYKERTMNTRAESSASLHRLVDRISEWRRHDTLA